MPIPGLSSRSLYDIFAVINYKVAPKLIGVIGCRHTGGGRAGAGDSLMAGTEIQCARLEEAECAQ